MYVSHMPQLPPACIMPRSARRQSSGRFILMPLLFAGRSFVVGAGKNYPKQVSHRDAACSLEDDAAGKCDRCVAHRLHKTPALV